MVNPRSRSRSRGRAAHADADAGAAGAGDPSELKTEIEGPNDKSCYRCMCEVPNIHGKQVVRAAGPWQADQESAERDKIALLEAFARGGKDELYRAKSELFAAARTRFHPNKRK